MQKIRHILEIVLLASLLAACGSQPVEQERGDTADVEIVDLSSGKDPSPDPAPQVDEPPPGSEPGPDEPAVPGKPDLVQEPNPVTDEPAVSSEAPTEAVQDSPQSESSPAPSVPKTPIAKAPVESPKPAAGVVIPKPERQETPQPTPPPAPAPAPAPAPEPVAQSKPAPPVAKPAPAPNMDMEKLETSLRKTKAIGLFTKLELKSQVEELLDQMKAYHEAKSKLSLDQLEQRFNLLVMKLMVLLQDDDPQLHREIAQARPVLWTTLADPVQFSSLKGP